MKYVLAVSGGVDSVVLLHKTATDQSFRRLHYGQADWPNDFAVAHFNHGIRGAESMGDALFVKRLCADYEVAFYMESANLGSDASEELARSKRYQFLWSICCLLGDASLVTAHHQDDLVETAVMNLIRGTSWRGLAPMRSDVIRPMLDLSKFDITSFALEHDLNWREDSTNQSLKYFRNRVRLFLQDVPPEIKSRLIDIVNQQIGLRNQIEAEIDIQYDMNVNRVGQDRLEFKRYYFIMLPTECAVEVINRATDGQLIDSQIVDLIDFIKIGKPSKIMQFKKLLVTLTKTEVMFTNSI